MKKLIVTVMFSLLLSSCEFTKSMLNDPNSLEGWVRIGTTQYISAEEDIVKRTARAVELNIFASKIVKYAEDNPQVTIPELETKVRSWIDYTDRTVADQILIDALIIQVRMRIEDYARQINAPSDYKVGLKTVMQMVVGATKLYGI